MKNNEQKSKPTPDTDKGDYTKPRRFYWSCKTHSTLPIESLVSEVAA